MAGPSRPDSIQVWGGAKTKYVESILSVSLHVHGLELPGRPLGVGIYGVTRIGTVVDVTVNRKL